MRSFISENPGLDGVEVFLLLEAKFLIIENNESALDNLCSLFGPTVRALLLLFDVNPQEPLAELAFIADKGLKVSNAVCWVSRESTLDS